MTKKFEEEFKATKAEVTDYLDKNEDGFDVDLGKGFKCEEGTVIYTSTGRTSVDKDKLLEMVKRGEVTIDQVFACVSTFKNEDLEKTLGSGRFGHIATKTDTYSLTFRGSAEFKAECEGQFKGNITAELAAIEPELKAHAKSQVDTIAAIAGFEPSAAKAKAAAAAAKARAKSGLKTGDIRFGQRVTVNSDGVVTTKPAASAEDEIDAILNEEE